MVVSSSFVDYCIDGYLVVVPSSYEEGEERKMEEQVHHALCWIEEASCWIEEASCWIEGASCWIEEASC